MKQYVDRLLAQYKACLVGNGKSLRPCIDCDEMFTPFVRSDTISMVLNLAVSHYQLVHQIYLKNAFLHKHLQPLGDCLHSSTIMFSWSDIYRSCVPSDAFFIGSETGPKRLVSSLCVLCFLICFFFHRHYDPSLFIYRVIRYSTYHLLYADDIVLTTSS